MRIWFCHFLVTSRLTLEWMLTHAIEAYVSTKATDFLWCLSLKRQSSWSLNTRLKPTKWSGCRRREKMHAASTLAGMAFNTASLGINHSLAHAAGAVPCTSWSFKQYFNAPCHSVQCWYRIQLPEPAGDRQDCSEPLSGYCQTTGDAVLQVLCQE